MRKVPKAFFDYADRGSYSEDTLRANRDDLQAISSASAFLSMSRNETCRPRSWASRRRCR